MCISVLDYDAGVLQRHKVPIPTSATLCTRLLSLLFMTLRHAASGRCRGFRDAAAIDDLETI